MKITVIKANKPLYLGLAILVYGDRIRLCYMDTDNKFHNAY